jgi:hypothetical protein
MKHTVFAACLLGLMSSGGVAVAEDAGAFWQPAREKFNKMSDDACDGDGAAFRELMQAAVMDEHPVARNDLAWVFATERCAFYDDDIEAVAYLQQQAADAGYPVAQNNIGVKYMEGTGVEKNVSLAEDYFEAAMRAGYGKSAAQLGIYYAEGVHVERNISRAEQLLEDAYMLEADPDMIGRLADALDQAVVGGGGSEPEPAYSTDRWSYYDSEASWDLVYNGVLLASVFVGHDTEFGEYYYGLYRVSDDPMIHFMGVSVEHSGGRETALDMNGCGGQNCLIDYGDSGQVRIPISASNQAAILEAFKSGDTVKFRYQTQASYAKDQFKTMAMSLKGSRNAIEALEQEAAMRAQRLAARSSRSKASRKRERSALVKPLPPPCRNGSAARKSAIRSRVASTLPMLAAVNASPLCLSTRAPASTHFAASGMSPVMTTSPVWARSAIHMSATSGPSGTITFSISGFCDGRNPPLETT